jgi:broad specificity phosphatase PhoE
VLTSPLSRCVSIAEPVAEHVGCDFDVEPRLVEIEFGDIEGITHEQMVKAGYQFPWGFSEVDDLSQPAPGAESFEHLFQRARSLLHTLKGLPGRTVCVTHGGFTRAVMAAAYNGDLHEFWHYSVANVSSQVFSTDGRRLYLEAFGLTPEEVMRRMADPGRTGTVNARGEY